MHVISVAFKQYRSDDESCEGTNTEDPTVNFEREASRTEDKEVEDMGLSAELERIITQEDREMRSHQEETEIVNLGDGDEKKEETEIVNLETAPVHDEVVVLLKDYQDVFAWSYLKRQDG